jgi:RimJ/RimL family protein N-acetyltransferase
MNFFGFRSEVETARRFEADGFLGADGGKLVVEEEWHADRDGLLARRGQGPPPGSRSWNLGITFLPEWRGKGLAAPAQRLLCEYLFAATAVERIEAITDVENRPERRALLRAAFTEEGVLRRAQFRGDQWRDMALYSRLRGE